MAFFSQNRNFFIFFILFGIWTTWQNSKHKFFLHCYSIFSIVQIIFNFLFAIIFDRLYECNTLSNIVANMWFFLSIFAHLIIVLETIYQNETQLKLIRGFSRVDRTFAIKLCVKVPYRNEKHRLLTRVLMMMSVEILTKSIYITYSSIYGEQLHNLFYVTFQSGLVIILKLAQVSFFVSIIDARLCLLNKKLIEFQSANAVQITDKNFFKDQNKLKKFRATFSVYQQLLNLKRIYGELHSICERIGDSFGWSLLVVIVDIFANFSLNSYWVFMDLSINQDSLHNSISLARYLIVMGAVSMWCSSCCHQVRLK